MTGGAAPSWLDGLEAVVDDALAAPDVETRPGRRYGPLVARVAAAVADGLAEVAVSGLVDEPRLIALLTRAEPLRRRPRAALGAQMKLAADPDERARREAWRDDHLPDGRATYEALERAARDLRYAARRRAHADGCDCAIRAAVGAWDRPTSPALQRVAFVGGTAVEFVERYVCQACGAAWERQQSYSGVGPQEAWRPLAE